MNRRRLLQTFAAATLAAAMDVVGLKPIGAPQKLTPDEEFIAQIQEMFCYMDVHVVRPSKELLPEGLSFKATLAHI